MPPGKVLIFRILAETRFPGVSVAIRPPRLVHERSPVSSRVQSEFENPVQGHLQREFQLFWRWAEQYGCKVLVFDANGDRDALDRHGFWCKKSGDSAMVDLKIALAPMLPELYHYRKGGYSTDCGLRDLVRVVIGQSLDKEHQVSDWCASVLTNEQIMYARLDPFAVACVWSVYCEFTHMWKFQHNSKKEIIC